MPKQSTIIGLVGGLLFFAHAMINNSHAWPLVWPALAGVLAVWTAGGHRSASYGADLGKTASAGLIAGAVFVAATAAALARLDLLGNVGVSGLAFAGALGLLVAVIAGGLTHPLATRAGLE